VIVWPVSLAMSLEAGKQWSRILPRVVRVKDGQENPAAAKFAIGNAQKQAFSQRRRGILGLSSHDRWPRALDALDRSEHGVIE